MRACLFAFGLLLLSGACHGSENVVPFVDSGDPCAAGMHIDCGQYPETRCVADVDAGCARVTYGCADAAYFTGIDTSRCPEAGLDSSSGLGDASLIHGPEGGADGASGEGGDR
jgi:hypothetical protein